ncbi:DUF6884 domain-containing protein [Streptomyces sp. NPDC020667]|uniref:DUF6884 domain-containing protein n=1 Tax=Streptomyces sp. NPDC020667 TaxID=3154895 RepID=UPI00340CA668
MSLSPTGARILAGHTGGDVRGHAAAMASLAADRLVTLQTPSTGRMTAGGHAALAAWRAEHGDVPQAAPAVWVAPKLPGKQHEAVLTAARRPDQLVAGRDDRAAYWGGDPWFRRTTLRAVHEAGYADVRREPGETGSTTWESTGRSLYLTPAGRAYARQRGGIAVERRRVVIIACGQEKRPDRGRQGYPAGELYTGQYHRSLRRAADALTDPSLIRIVSAFHGLLPLDRPVHPYDVTLGSERAVTVEKMFHHAAVEGLDDADVIFLGGRGYAELLLPSVPHLLFPLVGGVGEHRGLCRQVREDPARRDAWWARAAALFTALHPAS